MLKKILIIIIIILILVAGAIGIRLFLNQNTQEGGQTQDQSGGIFGFLGFGDTEPNTPSNPGDTQNNQGVDTNDRSIFIPTLRQLTETPVAGATFIGTSTIRYVDRGTGHVYDADVLSYDSQKISNTTLPEIYNAEWSFDGRGVVYQQLEEGTIKTSYLSLNEPEDSSADTLLETISTPLPDNITSLSFSEDSNQLAFIVGDQITIGNPVSVGDADFKVPGNEWLIDWKDSSTLSLTTKASGVAPGFNYTTNTSGALFKELENIYGLTTHTKDNFVLYSESAGTSFSLFSQNTTDQNVVELPTTLPEKCALRDLTRICGVPQVIPNNVYPDAWYQGMVSFTDTIVDVDLETGESFNLFTPNQAIDITKPEINEDASFLLFVNKKDLTLWVLNIDEALTSADVDTDF